MKLARVVATVVSTVHHPIIDRRRRLLCDYLDARGHARQQLLQNPRKGTAESVETIPLLDFFERGVLTASILVAS